MPTEHLAGAGEFNQGQPVSYPFRLNYNGEEMKEWIDKVGAEQVIEVICSTVKDSVHTLIGDNNKQNG